MRDFLRSSARAALFFYGLLVTLTALATWTNAARPDLKSLPFTLTWPLVLGAVAGFIVALLRRPPLRRVAEIMDALGGTRDRLITALDFSDIERASDMELLAIREAGDFVRARDFRSLLPIRPPEELRWLVVPLAALAILWWDGLRSAAERDARIASATTEVAGTVKQLETLADKLAVKSTDDEHAKRIAERLKQSAAQIRAEARQGGEAQKAALREMAKLEELVKELRRPDAATPAELGALADALAKHELTKDAAKDMKEGSLSAAAKKLADAAKNEEVAAQAQQAIQQALDHLAQQKEQLSKQLEQLRQQAQQGGERQQLLQQLSELLNDMQKQGKLAQQQQQNGKQQGGGKQMTDDDLKKLLGALQRMKDQQQNDGESQQGEGDPQGESPVSMLSFGKPDKNGGDNGDPLQPSGQPGTDKDKGTTATPFGKETAANDDPDMRDQLSGRLAEGESLSALIPTTGGDAKAARRYKELYNTAASAAEDAVTQENIPLGSRFLIKRYFEAIRPKQ